MAGEDKQGPAISGHWREMDPKTLVMAQHIGTMKIGKPDGSEVEWDLSAPLGGLGIIVRTDDRRRFILPGADVVRALATELLGQEVG